MATTRRTVRQLVPRLTGKKRLPEAGKRGAIVGGRGKGLPGAETDASNIKSPFTEITDTRTRHATSREITSPDGFLVLEYYNTKQIRMSDATGRAHEFNYADVASA